MVAQRHSRKANPTGRRADVALIWMPFSNLKTPAIGLSLLKQTVLPLRVTTELLYLNLVFGQRIGMGPYETILRMPHHLLAGDWAFSNSLFDGSVDDDGYIQNMLHRGEEPHDDATELPSRTAIRRLLKAKLAVPSFMEECTNIVASLQPRVIGFSVIFQQRNASLSLARSLKRVLPHTVIVFGGAGCEGSMGRELFLDFPYVDVVVSGDGETVFPEIVRRVLRNEPLIAINGILARDGDGFVPDLKSGPLKTFMTKDMDNLPYPVYDDYYEQVEKSGFADRMDGRIVPFETSRGCWWGEKKQCIFCGFNCERIAYRSKSSRRVSEEMSWMIERYQPSLIAMADAVLNRSYLYNLIPALKSEQRRSAILWETRVNLSKSQLRTLRDAGVVWLQPGIESLSSSILKLVQKGATTMQNIQFLKWCKELGIGVYWNFIYGFPGEPINEYDRMAEFVPFLSHLSPPANMGRMRLDRFSPYFENPEQYGITDIAPIPAYAYIYQGLDFKSLFNMAYYFTFRSRSQKDVQSYTKRLRDRVDEWISMNGSSALFFLDNGETLTVWDQRPIALQGLTLLSGVERRLYLECDGVASLSRLCRLLKAEEKREARRRVQDALNSLVDRCLMVREGSSYLSLAIPVGEYRPGPDAWRSFKTFLTKREESSRLEKLMSRVRLMESRSEAKISPDEMRGAMHKSAQ